MDLRPRISTPVNPTPEPVEPPVPPAIPPAEEWFRTPLVRGHFPSEQPGSEPLLLTAASAGLRGLDLRARFGDFVALAPVQAGMGDALRAAQSMSTRINERNLLLDDPVIAVLEGAGWRWGVALVEGDGSEPIAADSARIPNFRTSSVGQMRPLEWISDVIALVADDHYYDLRSAYPGQAFEPTLAGIPASGDVAFPDRSGVTPPAG